MRALSIRQPWAWLILHAGKDIENRDWPTKLRGRVLVHASKTMTRMDYEAGYMTATAGRGFSVEDMPEADTLEVGGIVGSVEIVDCVTASNSRWFVGTYGFVLRDPQPLPFRPYKGALGFFEVPNAEFTGGPAGPSGGMPGSAT